MKHTDILLVGAGEMATEYAKVLKGMKRNFIIVGRGSHSSGVFKRTTGHNVVHGGINKWLSQNKASDKPPYAIIATSYNSLYPATMALLKNGYKQILIEKPGSLSWDGIKILNKEAKKYKAHLYIAYNRRFYSSVKKAISIIKTDGGVSSFHFEFTEWSHILSTLGKPTGLMQRWFFHNSSHVVDMAFFLGGTPLKMSSFKAGSLSWHPKASIFAGAGITNAGVPFSYNANWEAPGRWGVEIMTKKHRLIFRPLEKLQIQEKGSVEIKDVNIANKLDLDYKPGLYKEVQSFLTDKKDLCTIGEQYHNIKYYKKILG